MMVAGIGSRKGVSVQDVLAAIEAALEVHGLAMTALSALATTEFKRSEVAILDAGRKLDLPVIVVDVAGSEPSLPLTRPPLRSADLSPRGEEITHAGASLFSPAGRRWPEGPDEGAALLSRSDLSQARAGTPSVSEASALAAAGKGAKLLGPRTVLGPVTCAIAISGDAA
ncbi:cobalamin biosynthesis protein [Mesorhizobium muleiense]|uniref:Cobalt-precorrin 5A hydrolase n=1 Tax=Mesorhizobium muleiense TaxID=1004279 RepID=A0A1G8V225_9HYPH|nr:cobalamin biosynthesis protein [Mesorhizobium muleiense]MCF6102409.1 cobalamin biosynthesis protein [Mesorhizobium muleiense]SDJ59220.1 cobalt-precorrin 5A hydrolase [Mesorhizobium muleiense]